MSKPHEDKPEKRNRFEDWKPREIVLELSQRAVIVWMIAQLPGVSKANARIMRELYARLDLEQAQGFGPDDAHETSVHEITGPLLEFVIDELDKHMAETAPDMPPKLARHAIDLYEVCKEALEHPAVVAVLVPTMVEDLPGAEVSGA